MPHDFADQRCLGLATSIIGAIHLENPTRNGRAQFARPSNLCASLVDDGGGFSESAVIVSSPSEIPSFAMSYPK